MKSIQEPFVSYLSEKSRKKAETFSKKHDLFLQTPREVRKFHNDKLIIWISQEDTCLLYTSPSPRDDVISRMPSSA